MAMPEQKPYRSKQDYGTPKKLIRAVENRFGKLTVDLAATAENAKTERFISPEENSLVTPWPSSGFGWLNPPFERIELWSSRCAAYGTPRFRIAFLTPASVGSDWFESHVHDRALVLALKPRLVFDGVPPNPETGRIDCYPKDCILSVYGEEPGFEIWNWKEFWGG